MSDLYFFYFISQNFLDKFAKSLISSFLLLNFILFLFSFINIKTLFGAVFNFCSLKIFQLLNNIFINWVNHINNLNIFLFKSLDKWRSSSSGSRFSGNNINVFLVFFLSSKILFKWDHIFTWFRCMISKKLR